MGLAGARYIFLRNWSFELQTACLQFSGLRAGQVIAPRPLLTAVLDLGATPVATPHRLAPRPCALRLVHALPGLEQAGPRADPLEAVGPLELVVDVGVGECARTWLRRARVRARVRVRARR